MKKEKSDSHKMQGEIYRLLDALEEATEGLELAAEVIKLQNNGCLPVKVIKALKKANKNRYANWD